MKKTNKMKYALFIFVPQLSLDLDDRYGSLFDLNLDLISLSKYLLYRLYR